MNNTNIKMKIILNYNKLIKKYDVMTKLSETEKWVYYI